MPADLFFCMEQQIARVRAEGDLRRLAVGAATASGEAAESVHKVLIAEQGEVYVIAREKVVQADPGAINELKLFCGG